MLTLKYDNITDSFIIVKRDGSIAPKGRFIGSNNWEKLFSLAIQYPRYLPDGIYSLPEMGKTDVKHVASKCAHTRTSRYDSGFSMPYNYCEDCGVKL